MIAGWQLARQQGVTHASYVCLACRLFVYVDKMAGLRRPHSSTVSRTSKGFIFTFVGTERGVDTELFVPSDWAGQNHVRLRRVARTAC